MRKHAQQEAVHWEKNAIQCSHVGGQKLVILITKANIKENKVLWNVLLRFSLSNKLKWYVLNWIPLCRWWWKLLKVTWNNAIKSFESMLVFKRLLVWTQCSAFCVTNTSEWKILDFRYIQNPALKFWNKSITNSNMHYYLVLCISSTCGTFVSLYLIFSTFSVFKSALLLDCWAVIRSPSPF